MRLLGPAATVCHSAETVNYYVIAKQAAPFQIESNNHHSGIVTEIVQGIFSGSQYDIAYHTFPFNRMISILETGGEPNWLTYGSPTWGGVQAENLSDEPIYTVKHVLMSSKKGALEFKTMDDLAGKVVVLLHGFDYPQLTPFIKDGTVDVIRVKDYSAAFRIINKLPGEAAFVEMASRIKYHLQTNNQLLSDYNITSFQKVIPDYSIYLAFSPDMNKTLQTFINQRLMVMHQRGEIDTIVHHYY
ncbi:ABC-type amino acid transport/signal transduction system [Photobacterium aphoticum]|uniref:ABC-type amino acid transport/signal transduction system n=1 Tax=Photobacterium aphoticum TaxID=754436 RepID=A0A090QHL5_9GAMM|nr:ABC-type amino acid transport/signal transduction system [Photobacterium aphoticum]